MSTLTLRDYVEMVLEGYTLHPGARKILETAIAQELASQTASATEPLRNCVNCKHVDCHIDKEPCNSCTGPISYWEPKP